MKSCSTALHNVNLKVLLTLLITLPVCRSDSAQERRGPWLGAVFKNAMNLFVILG